MFLWFSRQRTGIYVTYCDGFLFVMENFFFLPYTAWMIKQQLEAFRA